MQLSASLLALALNFTSGLGIFLQSRDPTCQGGGMLNLHQVKYCGVCPEGNTVVEFVCRNLGEGSLRRTSELFKIKGSSGVGCWHAGQGWREGRKLIDKGHVGYLLGRRGVGLEASQPCRGGNMSEWIAF